MAFEYDAACIGQAVVDCIIRTQAEDFTGGIPRLADSVTLCPGGDAFNEAVILSRLGHRVRLVCGLGEDPAGRLVLEQAQQNGVDVSGVSVRKDGVTPVAALLVGRGGKRTSVGSPAERLPFYRPDPDDIARARVVSMASLFRAPLADAGLLLKIARAARLSGSVLCADLKLPRSVPLDLEEIGDVLREVDYLFPNREEGAYFTGETSPESIAEAFLQRGVGTVLVKLGSDGCYVAGASERFYMPALPAEAVDTTGAGDNFAAGFISALLRGRDLRGCAAFAAAAACIGVQSIGAVSGVRSREQVEALLRRQGL